MPRLDDKNVIGEKWVSRNKRDESRKVIRNKARFFCKGFSQQKGIDFGETYAPVAIIKSIRIFLAYSHFKNLKICQMDVKTIFLNDYLEEEVYMEHLEGFELADKPDHVYMLKKVLYGLKQAPKAWYSRLDAHLTTNRFIRGGVDITLYIKSKCKDILVVEIYVDDIIFGSNNDSLSKQFSTIIESKFEMSLLTELTFFYGSSSDSI